MGLFRVVVVALTALAAVGLAGTVEAADPAERRIDRNFTPAKKFGRRIAAIPASALQIAKGSVEVRIDGRDYELETLIVTPPGPGPFPLAVVSHGVAGKRALRKKMRLRHLLAVGEDFARRGYKVVIFARRGFASSAGTYAEWLGKECKDWRFVAAGFEGAKEYAATIHKFAQRPEIDGSTAIAVGQSGGGLAVSALGLLSPPGLVGIVNFSGGHGSRGRHGGGVCNETGFVGAFGNFGAGVRVPALWLYSTADTLFWPDLVNRAFEAYAGRGAPVRLEWVGSLWFSSNGHLLYRLGGRRLWRPRIDAFLNAVGAPNWKRAPDDADAARVPHPPGVEWRCYNSWLAYAGAGGHKAFALADNGRCSAAWWRDSAEEAIRTVLEHCRKRGEGCRIVSVDGRTPR